MEAIKAVLTGRIERTSDISVLEYIMSKNLDTNVCLLYSNRTSAVSGIW